MKIKFISILSVITVLLTACFWRNEVQTSEVGLELGDGVSVTTVLGAGRYTNNDWYAELKVIDVSNKTVEWEDSSLVTSDKQPISLKLALTYSRCRDEVNITAMFNDFRTEAFDDTALQVLVFSRIPSPAKTVTTEYSLDQMLGIAEGEQAAGRQVVEQALEDILSPELKSIHICLQQVTIADIGVDPAFLDALSQKAQAQIQREVAAAEAETLRQQLDQEEAQTEIDLEIARRDNLINEELAKAYEISPALVEIRKLELLAEMFDSNDLVIYVPAGSSVSTVLLGGDQGIVPIPSTPATEENGGK